MPASELNNRGFNSQLYQKFSRRVELVFTFVTITSRALINLPFTSYRVPVSACKKGLHRVDKCNKKKLKQKQKEIVRSKDITIWDSNSKKIYTFINNNNPIQKEIKMYYDN